MIWFRAGIVSVVTLVILLCAGRLLTVGICALVGLLFSGGCLCLAIEFRLFDGLLCCLFRFLRFGLLWLL